MLRLTLFSFMFSVAFCGEAQRSFFTPSDSLNKNRFIGVSVGVGSVWAGSMVGLSQIWYADSEKTKWHAFNDSKDWLQMDKAGHYYTAYKLNQLTTDLFRWSGYNRRKSLWIGRQRVDSTKH